MKISTMQLALWGGKANNLLQKLVTVWANNYGCSKQDASAAASAITWTGTTISPPTTTTSSGRF